MGFDITIEIEAGGTSSKLSQFDEDGKVGAQINGPCGLLQRQQRRCLLRRRTPRGLVDRGQEPWSLDCRSLRERWCDHHHRPRRHQRGRQRVRRSWSTAASSSAGRTATLLRVSWADLGDPAANQGRTELLRYDSPTIGGFVASASIGEAGDYWGVMLRYAGEFSGFRVAAGIGYENVTDRPTTRAGSSCRSRGPAR